MSARLTLRLLRDPGKRMPSASHLRGMLTAHIWHISLHFCKLLSQPPPSDPDENPGRQIEEVINAALGGFLHSLNRYAEHLWPRSPGVPAGKTEAARMANALPWPGLNPPEGTQVHHKLVTALT